MIKSLRDLDHIDWPWLVKSGHVARDPDISLVPAPARTPVVHVNGVSTDLWQLTYLSREAIASAA